jgi:hypothetical protein
MQLFTRITLPSIMNQSCQDFTWLVLIDKQTPPDDRRMLADIGYCNMQLIFPTSPNPWLAVIEPSDYDLITTRIDNDDAFHRDVVGTIQQSWSAQNAKLHRPWVIVFPFGFILDLATKEMSVMEYRFNNCPTLLESAQNAQTIWQWDHSNIPPEIDKHFITDKPYWLQVIHSQNLLNRIPVADPRKIIHRQLKPKLEFLRYFGIDANCLPDA